MNTASFLKAGSVLNIYGPEGSRTFLSTDPRFDYFSAAIETNELTSELVSEFIGREEKIHQQLRDLGIEMENGFANIGANTIDSRWIKSLTLKNETLFQLQPALDAAIMLSENSLSEFSSKLGYRSDGFAVGLSFEEMTGVSLIHPLSAIHQKPDGAPHRLIAFRAKPGSISKSAAGYLVARQSDLVQIEKSHESFSMDFLDLVVTGYAVNTNDKSFYSPERKEFFDGWFGVPIKPGGNNLISMKTGRIFARENISKKTVTPFY